MTEGGGCASLPSALRNDAPPEERGLLRVPAAGDGVAGPADAAPDARPGDRPCRPSAAPASSMDRSNAAVLAREAGVGVLVPVAEAEAALPEVAPASRVRDVGGVSVRAAVSVEGTGATGA